MTDPIAILQSLPPEVAFRVIYWSSMLQAIIAIWVSMDARDRGWSRVHALAWGAAVLFLQLPLFVAYLILRNRVPRQPAVVAAPVTRNCPYCGQLLEGTPDYCPHCSSQLKGADEIHHGK
jgi:hypothetical protein